MSWKNYNGLLVENATTLADIEKIVEELQTQIKEFMRQAQAKSIKSEACLLYDMFTVFDKDLFTEKDKDKKPLLAATMQSIISSREEKEDIYESSIGFAHVDGYTLAVFFAEKEKDVREIILSHPSIKDFAYWDNTDPPSKDEVSKYEWNLRKRLWKKAFEERVTPAQRMAIYQLSNKNIIFPQDKEMEEIITVEEREKLCSERLSLMEVAESWKNKPEQDLNMYDFLMEVNKLKKEKYNEFVKGKLDPNLTMRDLEKPLEVKE